jgi:hypothetical protein
VWFFLFNDIPKGKAVVMEGKNGKKALAALAAAHKQGKFKNLQGCVRQGVCYIIHELEDSS